MFRVPLDTDAEGMAFQLQCFRYSIVTDSCYMQAPANPVRSLVVQTVHFQFFGLQNLMQLGIRRKGNIMAADSAAFESE